MANSSQYEIAINIAGKLEKSFMSAFKSAGSAVKGLTKTFAAASTASASAIGAVAAASINVGKEFESSMSQVAATMLLDKSTAEGAEQFQILEDAARKCGRETAFSAGEAAEGLNYLALAGYDATQAAEALPTVLKLAGAGAMDLASASDMVTDSMAALGIEATKDNLTQFSDQLAKTASKSNTSVSQLGEAILTVGGTAKSLKGGISEMNTALGQLANVGIKSAEGGTHLRNIILSLSAPTDTAAGALERLGVETTDANGNLLGLDNVMDQLNSKLAVYGSADRASFLSQIFNKTDLTAVNGLMSSTVKTVDELSAVMEQAGYNVEEHGHSMSDLQSAYVSTYDDTTNLNRLMVQFGMSNEQAMLALSSLKSVAGDTSSWDDLKQSIEDSAGACEQMYGIQLDNLEGDISILKSGLSDLGISIYKDMNAPLREMTQLATDMVSQLSQAFESGGMEGMVAAIGDVLATVVEKIATFAPQLMTMAMDLLQSFINGISQNSSAIAKAASDTLTVFIDGALTMIPQIILLAADLILKFADGIADNLPSILNTAVQAIATFAQGVISRLPELIQVALKLIQSLQNGLIQNLPLILQSAVQLMVALVQGIAQNLPLLIQQGIQMNIAFIQGILNNLPLIIQSAIQIVIALAAGLIQAIPQLLLAVPQLISAIAETLINTNWIEVGLEVVKGIGKGILGGIGSIKDIFTGKGEENGEALSQATANGLSNNIGLINSASDMASNSALTGFQTGSDKALTFGMDVSNNFATGITQGSEGLDSIALAVGENSMNSIYQGMQTGAENLSTATSEIGTNTINSMNDSMVQGSLTIQTTMQQMGTDAQNTMNESWNKVQSDTTTAWQNIDTQIRESVNKTVNAVKEAFANMQITIPKPKLPDISVSYSTVNGGNGGSVDVPKFNVNWNAKGGIFNSPTIFGTNSGLQGVGEAGAEAILPLNLLWDKMSEIISDLMFDNSNSIDFDSLLSNLDRDSKSDNNNNYEYEPTIQYSPVYKFYGAAPSKEDLMQASRMSQDEFDRMMKKWQKDNGRFKFA